MAYLHLSKNANARRATQDCKVCDWSARSLCAPSTFCELISTESEDNVMPAVISLQPAGTEEVCRSVPMLPARSQIIQDIGHHKSTVLISTELIKS